MQRSFILLVAVLALLAAAPSAHAAKRTVPRGFFSVMWDRAATEAPAADQETQWGLMAKSGVESVRTVFNWALIEPQPGVFDYSGTDQVVAQASRRRIALLPVLRTAPPWAKINPFAPESPPRNTSDFAVFVQALIGRYGPQGSFWTEHPELPKRPLRTWQIWNEPHLQEWWNTEGRSPNAWAPEYAALLKTAKKAIDAADPGATVVLAALADYAWNHLARLNRYGIGGYYDVAAINLFTARPTSVMRGVRYVRRQMRLGGARRKPIWLTESTWPAGKGRVSRPAASWQQAWYTTDTGMAKRLRAVYALAIKNRRKLRLGRVVWYTWSSAYNAGDLFDYSGLLRYTDGAFEQRPALAAYASTARRYEGCRKTAEGRCR